jgi:hypothetical protein
VASRLNLIEIKLERKNNSCVTDLIKFQNIHKHSHEHKKNNKIRPLSEEALAVFCQFPTDVLEEIFVRAIDLPSSQLSASSWKMVLQVKQFKCPSWWI